MATQETAEQQTDDTPQPVDNTTEDSSNTSGDSKFSDFNEADFLSKPTLFVSNVHKHVSNKVFMKEITNLGIKALRIRKLQGKNWAHVVFEDDDLRDAGRRLIEGHMLRNLRLSCKDSVRNRGKDRDPSNPKNHKRAAPDSTMQRLYQINKRNKKNDDGDEEGGGNANQTVEDIVTPLWKLSYEEQLLSKQKEADSILRQILPRIKADCFNTLPDWFPEDYPKKGKEETPRLVCPLSQIVPSPEISGYRNKVNFTIGYNTDNNIAVGFLHGRVAEGISSVGEPTNCLNVREEVKLFGRNFQSYLSKSAYKPYDKSSHTGFWRTVLVRTNRDGEMMVSVQINPSNVESSEVEKEEQRLVEFIKSLPEPLLVTSFFVQYYSGISNFAPPDLSYKLLLGKDHIFERLFDLKFYVSPSSFFQVNTRGAEELYRLIGDVCDVNPSTLLLDVCCGTGTIGLTLAKRVRKVVGFEIIAEAVKDARRNAQENNIDNAEFVAGKAEEELPKWLRNQKNFQENLMNGAPGSVVAVVDPARCGLHIETVKALRATPQITKIVYVSCNPVAFLLNASQFGRPPSKTVSGLPFRPTLAIPVDLFPHTTHYELIVLLERVDSRPSTSVEKVFPAASVDAPTQLDEDLRQEIDTKAII